MRLKHFLSVFLTLLTLSVGQMWGAVDYIIPKLYLTSKNTPSGNTGWTFTNDITINNASTDYWKMIKSSSVATSPSFDISNYSSVTVSVKWQNFGTFNSSKCNATVKISTGSNTWYTLGTTGLTAAGTTTKTFENVETHSSYSSAQIQISTPNADNSVGGRLFIVEIKGEAATTCSTPPTVGTNLTSVSATANSITATVPISSIGGCNITENGLVYSSSVSTPTVGAANCIKVTTTACGATAANKTVTINELACGTTYYVRGFATNGANTSYTNVKTQATSACPKYTVTLKDDETELEQATAGASITLPSRSNCSGYTFAGWSTSNCGSSEITTPAPTVIPAGSYTPPSNIDLYPVYTRTGGTPISWDKVTALSEITAGTYVIVSDGCALQNTAASSSPARDATNYGVTISNDKITSTVSDAMKWSFTVANSAVTIKSFANSNNYLYNTGNNSNTGVRVGNTSDTWTFVLNTSAPAFAMYDATKSRYCCSTIDTYNDWRSYNSAGAGNYRDEGKIYLFKQSGGTITYYISEPNCCTELGQINGSVF